MVTEHNPHNNTERERKEDGLVSRLRNMFLPKHKRGGQQNKWHTNDGICMKSWPTYAVLISVLNW